VEKFPNHAFSKLGRKPSKPKILFFSNQNDKADSFKDVLLRYRANHATFLGLFPKPYTLVGLDLFRSTYIDRYNVDCIETSVC
jgi:hypothetical protein